MRREPASARDLFRSAGEADRFAASLGTALVGGRVLYFEAVGSTNDVLKGLACEDAPAGLVAVAEEQTAGRGREGRAWHSPPGAGLYFSYVLRPRLEVALAAWLTGTAALGAAAAIREFTGVEALIEWPNDVVVDGRKLGGVLAESRTSGGAVDFAAVGVGLNVDLDAGELPGDLRAAVTSLAQETGEAVDRRALFAAVLAGIDSRVALLAEGRTAELADEFNALCRSVGLPLERPGAEAGTAEGVDELCRMIVRTSDGRKAVVTT